jgi:hypothetical protein
MYGYILCTWLEDRAMLASNPSANQVPYGTGGFSSEKPPAFHFAVGKKAINASSSTG